MSVQRIHHHTVRPESYFLRSQVILIVIFITGSEPIRIIWRIGIACVIIWVVRNFLLNFQFWSVIGSCFLSLLDCSSSFVNSLGGRWARSSVNDTSNTRWLRLDDRFDLLLGCGCFQWWLHRGFGRSGAHSFFNFICSFLFIHVRCW